ncbi:MAG: alpha/beta hydrolase [Actinomycetota bacterium]
MDESTVTLATGGTTVQLAVLQRGGSRPPLVCLHGFGSTKEDYADLALHPAFADRGLVLLDAPGCGASTVDEPAAVTIPFLVEVAAGACDALGLDRFHLSGHSMGGLTALLLANARPERVLSFVDIEGNLAPEDCFLSRQIIDFPADDEKTFFDAFVERVAERPEFASRLYATSLPLKVRPSVVHPIFTSMVELSDTMPLLDLMAGLRCPRVFVYGEQNRHLSYLDGLPGIGVETAEIQFAGHFPMYSNPVELWAVMAEFLDRCDASTPEPQEGTAR